MLEYGPMPTDVLAATCTAYVVPGISLIKVMVVELPLSLITVGVLASLVLLTQYCMV